MRNLDRVIRERFATGVEIALRFWSDEQGQDIADFTLLLSFLMLAFAGVVVMKGTAAASIWAGAKTIFGQASFMASGPR
jgi:hypothetical protein